MAERVLFICSQNKLRSPTAEQVFSTSQALEYDSAGLAPDTETQLSTEQIEWAQTIFVMKRSHKNKHTRR